MKDLPKTKDLILNFKNGWLDILFDNVKNRNALKDNLIEELFIVFDLIRNDKAVRGVLLRGNGGVFCAGADLKAFMGMQEEHNSTIPAPKEEVLIGELFKSLHFFLPKSLIDPSPCLILD